MREILYRGFAPRKNGTTEITLNGVKIKGEWKEGLPNVMWHKWWMNYADNDGIAHEICRETIFEHIGLTDKNGKKIFECDIVKAKSISSGKEEIYLIKFEQTSLWFGFKSRYSGYVFSLDELLQEELGDEIEFEVIGNIFENPELLEV